MFLRTDRTPRSEEAHEAPEGTMETMRGISKWSLVVSAAMIAACGSEATDTPAGGVGVGFRAVKPAASQGLAGDTTGAGLTLTDEVGTVYTLTSTKVNLRDIELDLPAGTRCNEIEAELAGGARCASDGADDSSSGGSGNDQGGGDKVRIDGPFTVDLLAGTATPSLAEVRVPALAWDRIDFRIEPADAGELAETAWRTTATFDRDGVPTELTLALRFNEDIRVEADGGVTVDPAAPLLVRLDVTQWLSAAALGACIESGEADDGDAISIDDRTRGQACGSVEGALKESIKRSMQLDRDELSDDDGRSDG